MQLRGRSQRVLRAALFVTIGLMVAASDSRAEVHSAPKSKEAASPSATVPDRSAEPGASVPKLVRVDLEPWLDGFMEAAMAQAQIAGAVVSVVKGGTIVLAKGYGFSDVAAQSAVQADQTLFRPGSISKLFGATAILQLVGSGKVDLSADVAAYIDFTIPPHEGGPIRVRDLLTHTAGFEEQAKDLINPDHALPLREYVRKYLPARIYAAGTTPAYSNYGAALLGYIVERVSEEPFEEYVDRHIFAPLEMHHSTFHQPPARSIGDLSNGYDNAMSPPRAFEYVNAIPAGALSSTGTDMANFMIMNLQDGRFADRQVLPAEIAQLMHAGNPAQSWLPDRMALGFYERSINGHRAIVHGGDTELFHSDLSLFLDDGVGLFVSLNSTGTGGSDVDVRSLLFRGFADRYLPEQNAQKNDSSVDAQTASLHARMLEGIWESSRRYETSFASIQNLFGGLEFVANPDNTIEITGPLGIGTGSKRFRETRPFVWRELGGREWIALEQTGNTASRVAINSPIAVFTRPSWWRSPQWLLPLYLFAILSLVLTLVIWVVRYWLCRSAPEPAKMPESRLIRTGLQKSGVVAAVGTELAWLLTSAFGLTKFSSPSLDLWVLTLQVLSFFTYSGAAAALLTDAVLKSNGHFKWRVRLWSMVLALSALTLLWDAVVFHLIGFSVRY
jgi:CubicO group peptidase (beta-lactamase class C family)